MRATVDNLRRTPAVRRSAQVVVVLLLLVAGWSFNERITTEESETATVNAILAQSCGAASFSELREQGLVEECRLAQAGTLPDAIPDDTLAEPNAEPQEVDPDVVEDDKTSTPADVRLTPLGPTDAQTAAAVDAWFEDNPLSAQPGYERAIQRATSVYLSANPPADGRPPTRGEIADAVRAALVANPPADGRDGQPGRGVISTVLDGCDVVFTYSDGSTDRVGPICGADGQPGPGPSDEQVASAVVAYCEANGACRGPAGPPGVVRTADECQPADGEFVTDVSIRGPEGDPATVTVVCQTAPILPPFGGGG